MDSQKLSEIEKLIIHYSSLPISLLVFGMITDYYTANIEESINSTYQKIKDFVNHYTS